MKRKSTKANLLIQTHRLDCSPQNPVKPTQRVTTIPVARYYYLPSGNLGRSTTYQSIEEQDQARGPTDEPSYDAPLVEQTYLEEDHPLHTATCFDPAYIEHLDQTNVASRQPRAADHPLKRWLLDRDLFVSEDLRWDGRGEYTERECPHCGIFPAAYRCEDCEGGRLLCQSCMVEFHHTNALHRIKSWNGQFFQKTSLKAIGLRIQLGHRVGEGCSNPKAAFADEFIVIHVNGIHSLALDFCDCERAQIPIIQLLRYRWFPATVDNPKSAATFTVLRQFHLLSFESKVSCFEYYHALVRLTDNTTMDRTKDRYSAFLRMVREYRHIKMLKRSGRGHDPSGASGTKPGECAVICPACPQPGYNLPVGWENTSPKDRWLYGLFLAIDANFRLKRKHVSNSVIDPPLGDGMSYFVKRDDFIHFLNAFGTLVIQDPSTCSNHKAVDAERSTKGLSATGVGTIDCARHDVKRPKSVGDLQKGKRYLNMDYLYFSSLKGSRCTELVVSYDIACQWGRKIWDRMRVYPEELHFGPDENRNIRFLIPKFHLPAHIMSCQTTFSFNFNHHVGRTDGEAPERGWSHINPVATSTREMGPGSRQDTLDDHFGDWNWKKTTLMGVALLRKIRIAVDERNQHVIRHNQFEAGLEDAYVKRWKVELGDWLGDHTKPNPFEPCYKPLTQNAVRRELANQEAADMAKGTAYVLHETVSASQMIIMGLDLEEQQRRLVIDAAKLGTHSTDIQNTHIQFRRNVLKRKIEAWLSLQHLYIPALIMVRSQNDNNQADDPAEQIPLMLPSALKRPIPCDPRLHSIEWKLRKSQANDALDDLREGLRLRAYLYIDKDRFQRGQHYNLRSRSVIQRVQVKINSAVQKYRVARKALSSLSSPLKTTGWETELPPLLDGDIRQLSGDDTESEGRRTLSWIWTRLGERSQLSEEEGLQDVLRIEWCKSKSRADRWSEEVTLLREEMRRVIQFFTTVAEQWEGRAQGMCFIAMHPASHEGIAAYSAKQASQFRAMRAYCQRLWRLVPQYTESGDIEDVIPPEITLIDDGED